MPRIGFLHTADAHVAAFDALLPAGVEAVHVVEPDLLSLARRSGRSAEVEQGVRVALGGLVDAGCSAVVCTCSTLGRVAEEVTAPVPVLRVDRPMIRAAVGQGSRIGVVAAVESTLAPTHDLIADEAAHAGVVVSVTDAFVPQAWTSFEAGATTAYLGQIADAARTLTPYVDVVVLAQASMADALLLLDDLPVPVLASPRLAVRAALELGG